MLSDSDSDENNIHTLTINEHFAKAFEYKKEREELAKLKEKYGSDYSDSSDGDSEHSEDTEEDSDGEELTPAVDAAILRTLALIKKKDPAIYENGRRVFAEEHTRTQDKAPATKPRTKEKSKSLTVKEAALAAALAGAHSLSRSPSPEPPPLTHAEEQALLRSETRAAFHDTIDSETQGDEDDLLIPRSRTRDEIELEEEEYKAFLEREVGENIQDLITVETNETIGDDNNEHDGKRKKKGKKEREREQNQKKGEMRGEHTTKHRNKESREEADHAFLINYIFNRGWIDHSARRVPTYNEIIGSSSRQAERKPANRQAESDLDDGANQNSDAELGASLSDENSFDDLADAFETSYNFRFEEPGGTLIASFPRNPSSARRESTTRKDARARKKERQRAEKQALLETRREEFRKERALVEAAVAGEDEVGLAIEKDISNEKKSKKQQRKEELARLRTLKANELRRKLEKVSAEGGLDGIGDEALAHLDLDADWDPSKHDAQMAELYDGDFGIPDDHDVKKPVWDDDINIDDISPPANVTSKARLKKERKKEKKKHTEVDVGVDVDEMDADVDWDARYDDDDDEWRGTEEERKRKVDAYMDEVVNRLGFSGIASHMPTRFHYTSTTPENYGLSPVEILLATDAELNSYVGLKKLAPYRVSKGGKGAKNWDPKRAQRLKEFRESLRARVGSDYEGTWSLAASAGSKSKDAGVQGEKKKRKGKKERARLKAIQGDKVDGEETVGNPPDFAIKSQKRERNSDIGPHTSESHPGETEINVEDGTRKKKRRRHHKKASGGGGGEAGKPSKE